MRRNSKFHFSVDVNVPISNVKDLQDINKDLN